MAADTAVAAALVAGATGLVGRAVVAALLADKTYQAIHTLGRRSLPTQHARLTQHTVDLAALPALSTLSGAVDHVYIALGTTIKIAGSQDAFKAVDLDAVVSRGAGCAGGRRHPAGRGQCHGRQRAVHGVLQPHQGQMEEAVSALGFDTVVIARPSLIDGDRDALGQPRPQRRIAGHADNAAVAAADTGQLQIRQPREDRPRAGGQRQGRPAWPAGAAVRCLADLLRHCGTDRSPRSGSLQRRRQLASLMGRWISAAPIASTTSMYQIQL